MKLALLALAGLFLAANPVFAQSALDQIEEQIGGRADELARVEAILTDPDPNRRIAGMEALLASGDPEFVRKALEVGLFSDDPRLREAAIRSVLNAGGAFRAEFTLPADQTNMTNIYEWLRRFNGSWSQDGLTGYFGFALGPFDPEDHCWLWHDSSHCALRMSGDEVMTVSWSYNLDGSAIMRLDDTGALTGAFLVGGSGTPVTIRIPLIN